MLVLSAEDMLREPGRTFETVQRFLHIPIAGTIPLRRYNERSIPRLDPATQAVLAEY